MVKDQLQQELEEKMKPGVKPSDLRKLKHSKSAGDIPSVPPSPATKIKQLEDKVSVLELTIETKDRELVELETEKKQLENQLNPAELDNSLIARHQNLKDWFKQYQQTKQLDQELAENIDEASTELVAQDEVIKKLRSENTRLQKTNQSLQKDLQLASRLAESRKVPYYSPEDKGTYLEYALYGLVAVCFISLLNSSWKVHRQYE